MLLNNSRLPKIESNDVLFLKELIEEHKLKPILNSTYSIDDFVEARKYVDTGRKNENAEIMVIDIEHTSKTKLN